MATEYLGEFQKLLRIAGKASQLGEDEACDATATDILEPSYLYRIMRYLTYNEPELPFPFSNFPPEVERVESDDDRCVPQ